MVPWILVKFSVDLQCHQIHVKITNQYCRKSTGTVNVSPFRYFLPFNVFPVNLLSHSTLSVNILYRQRFLLRRFVSEFNFCMFLMYIELPNVEKSKIKNRNFSLQCWNFVDNCWDAFLIAVALVTTSNVLYSSGNFVKRRHVNLGEV